MRKTSLLLFAVIALFVLCSSAVFAGDCNCLKGEKCICKDCSCAKDGKCTCKKDCKDCKDGKCASCNESACKDGKCSKPRKSLPLENIQFVKE